MYVYMLLCRNTTREPLAPSPPSVASRATRFIPLQEHGPPPAMCHITSMAPLGHGKGDIPLFGTMVSIKPF